MTCEGCKYWSELVAYMDHETGEILAMCLNPETPAAPSGTPPMVYRGCDRYAPGEPIDLRDFYVYGMSGAREE